MQLVSGTCYNIQHASNGSCSISITASGDLPNGSGWGPKWGEASAWVWLTHIPRQANFTNVNIPATNLNKFDVYYNLDKTVDAMQYRVNGGVWQNVYPWWGNWNKEATFSVEGLTPNTNYTVQLKATVNGIDTYSSVYNASTYDIAKFTFLNDFTFGDVINISKTNPSQKTNYLTIKTNEITIINRRYLETDNLALNFAQDELDILYKTLTNYNQNVDFILITNNGEQEWISSKTIKCIFKGNAKSIHYFIGDRNSKRAKMFYFDKDRESKKAIFIIKKNGKWRWCV